MALLYMNAQNPQEKVVDIITSSAILDNIKENFLREAKQKTGDSYQKIVDAKTKIKCDKCNRKKIDKIATIAEIYPNKEYCGNIVAKNFEGQLCLIVAIRNEFAHDERFSFILEQDWTGLRQQFVEVSAGGLEEDEESVGVLNYELCDLLTRADKKDRRLAKRRIHELDLNKLYSVFNYAFNQIRTFICMYRYDGPERDEYLFGILGGESYEH